MEMSVPLIREQNKWLIHSAECNKEIEALRKITPNKRHIF